MTMNEPNANEFVPFSFVRDEGRDTSLGVWRERTNEFA